jgi:glycosyltransferase involved in cell wall biosynthesis
MNHVEKIISIAIITYNHEDYIAQAIDSVLAQVHEHTMEIVIGDDYSTDKTRNILQEYRDRYPSKIRLLMPDKHIGMMNNFVDTLNACSGKYVAILEGDDYWCNDRKLESQISYLEVNPEYAITFHKVIKVYADDHKEDEVLNTDLHSDVYELEHLLSGNFIYTNSVCYRNRLFSAFPKGFRELPIGDWPLHILNAVKGKIHYDNRVMSVYRIHGGSEWSSKKAIYRKEACLKTYDFIINIIPKYLKDVVNVKISILRIGLGSRYIKEKNIIAGVTSILGGIIVFPFIGFIASRKVRESLGREYRLWVNNVSARNL